MPQAAERWTAEMVRALPDDGNRYEVIDGELLVSPSPAELHQRAVTRLIVMLAGPAGDAGGEVLASPADLELDPFGMVQPDVFVQGRVNGRLSMRWNSGAPLNLVIEVLSPGTARADRIIKRRRYQKAGIPEYWIVDLDARTFERWRPEERPEIASETISWLPPGGSSSLSVDVPAFFAWVHGEA